MSGLHSTDEQVKNIISVTMEYEVPCGVCGEFLFFYPRVTGDFQFHVWRNNTVRVDIEILERAEATSVCPKCNEETVLIVARAGQAAAILAEQEGKQSA